MLIRKSKIFLLLGLIGISFACGRKENPRPPEDFAPSSVQALSAAGEVDAIVLNWKSPETDARGELLKDLSSFQILRKDLEEGDGARFHVLDEMEIEQEKDKSAAVGKRFSYRDTNVNPGKRYEYFVLPLNDRGVEGQSSSYLRVTFIGKSSVVEALAWNAEQ